MNPFSARVGRRPSGFGRLEQRRHRPDYWLVILSVAMLVIGLVVVYSISPALAAQKSVSESYFISRQMLAILLGVVSFAIIANMPIGLWRKLEKPLIVISILAAVAVRFFGQQVNGAYRWIQIGGFSFQAAELIKFVLLIWLAGFLSDRVRSGEITNDRKTLKPLLIALALVCVVVGLAQKDLGSTGVVILMILSMGFIAGLAFRRIVLYAGVLAVAFVLLVLPFSYRRDRLATFLHPARDCLGQGYQTCQSLISIGSGGIFGKGLGGGVQAYGYQPEAANDSIFAIFAEKFGFLGVTILLGLFAALFARLKRIMERAPDTYSQLLVSGILAWLSTQTIINVGAMLGLLPLKGITLPFISYGGTSILFVTAAVGIAFQISRYTTYGIPNAKERAATKDYGPSRAVEYRSPTK